MGLIIKDHIQMLQAGYPTVSDKYNVSGAVLAGTSPVKFGDLVVKSTQTTEGNYFAKPGTTIANVAALGGFVVATNVKLAEGFASDLVLTHPGEAFNLLVNGFMAIELDDSAIGHTSSITANSTAAVFLSGASVGKVSYKGATSGSVTATDMPNVVFTGVCEVVNGKVLAEIYVK